MSNAKKIALVAVSGAVLVAVAIAMTAVMLNDDPASQSQPRQEASGASGAGGLAAADADGDGIVYQDGMHPWIVRDEPGPCPICGMDLVPVRVNAVDDGTVRIDPVTLQNIGVRTAPVVVGSLARTLRTTGRFEMDEQGAHAVSLKVSGWVERLHADYDGAIVQRGEPLLDLYSPELVATQEEYLLALRNLDRLEGTPAADDARRLLEAARRRMAFWDLSEDQLREVASSGEPQRTLRFYAPASGEVMERQVVEGQHVQAGDVLMRIVDISSIWLMVDVYEQDLGWVRPGVEAVVELPYAQGSTYRGRIDHLYHMLETDSRTARARITFDGAHRGPFQPGMYATVHLEGGQSAPGPLVPDEAVVRTGEREVVIVALGDGRFMPADVVTGMQAGGRTQILDGLLGDERVVTSAQFLIDSEARLRSAIGAMGGHDHGGTTSPPGSEMDMDAPAGDMGDTMEDGA